jgi:tight adherence protein B
MSLAFPVMLLLLSAVGIGATIAVLASVGLAFLLPVGAVKFVQQRRLAKILEQLPEAIDVLVRSLRAGHPVAAGVRMIATEMSDPIRTEFRLVSDAMTYGLDLRDAFTRMEQRLPIPELRYMTAAVRIQYETGGNLAEILAALSQVMRERLKLKLKVRALSAEGRLSGRILSVIPFAIAAFIIRTNPDYYAEASTNKVLAALLWFALLLVLVGIFTMQRMLKIKV